MDLQIATIADIVNELRCRQQLFILVGIENTNRQDKEVTYAYQGGSHAELRLMLSGLHRMLTDNETSNEKNDLD